MTVVFGTIDDAVNELDDISEEFDSYLECVDAIELDDAEFDEKIAACDE